ncbi:unnamed protein product [Acanthoscelides obtectus]|uniref:superoxide dismutase n=1 Tax=Acanthoscelides obtectus TaxID=200917 RepID=A0A9P0KPP5_ACAOB|nr:unnamed protein product [Acanthoscelides obtectus]CAK1657754.1 Copper chaperone for superoxide dismutase [Acanthoscelides obtectus]
MSSTKIEFAVQMTCDSCVNSVRKTLENVEGIKNVDINLEKQSVVVDSNLPTLKLQKLLESSGKKVAVKGFAGSTAAVSILEAGDKSVQGVVRFVQVSPKSCLIDGTLDGLKPGPHHVYVHECGDISQGCTSVGDVFNPPHEQKQRTYGDIGQMSASEDGRAAFRIEDDVINVPDIIGRSLVVTDGEGKKRLACGIIARSAGLFQNPKTICACDGVTIWDEVSKPKKAAL